MKTKLILLSLLTAALAFAEPVKLKFNEIAELGGALRALDGAEKPVQTSDQGTRVVRVPLELKATTRIVVAKDLVAIRAALEAFEQTRQQLLQKVSPGFPQKVSTDQELLNKFMLVWNDATKEPVTLELSLLTEDQLNLDANKEITGTVLAGLTPILKK